MSSLSHTLSFSSSRPQQRQLSPPHSHKSENHILPRPFATMSTNNNGGKTQQTHSYFGMSNTGSSMDNPHTPPTPPMLSLSNSSKHHQQKQTLPSLPKILEPPFAPSSAALFSTSTTATSPYPAIPTAASASNITINTPFTSSTSVDSSSSSSSPLHHCKWRNCIRSFHGPEQLYQHLCDEHVGRHARGNLCLECRWEDCQTVTNKRDHITSHLRVHVPLTPLRCRICDKRYKRRQDLKKHERKHMERLELSSTQLAGSELSSIVHPLPGTVLPDIHHPHSRHATVGTSVQHHHPYSAHSYSPSASSSTTSLRSGSPSYRPLASPGAMPPQLPSVNLHPHYSQHSSHPQPSHTHYSHQHSTLPALTTPGASASPPSFTVPLGNGTRNGSASSPSLVPQSAMDYSPQSYHAHSQSTLPPSTFAPHHSTALPQPYVYSQQPSHPPMASNPPSMSAPPSHTRHVQSVPHLPLPPVTQINGYHRS